MTTVEWSAPDEGESDIAKRNRGEPVGALPCCGCALYLWNKGPMTPICPCHCHDLFRAWGRMMGWWS